MSINSPKIDAAETEKIQERLAKKIGIVPDNREAIRNLILDGARKLSPYDCHDVLAIVQSVAIMLEWVDRQPFVSDHLVVKPE